MTAKQPWWSRLDAVSAFEAFWLLVRINVWVLAALLIASIVTTNCACAPGAAIVQADDNGWCVLEGSTEQDDAPIRLRVTTSFAYEGGTCAVDCTGIPPATCTIVP